MIRRPPRATRTDTLFPYTTLFRAHEQLGGNDGNVPLAPLQQQGSIRQDHVAGHGATHGNRSQELSRIKIAADVLPQGRSEEHTSELQSLMRISYAVFCLKTKK